MENLIEYRWRYFTAASRTMTKLCKLNLFHGGKFINLMLPAIGFVMADENIDGIHNYCDRWCERCYFTTRCAVYEDDAQIPAEERDISNRAFWERLSVNFAKARQMLEETAKNAGVDLHAVSREVEDYETKKKRIKKQSQDHALSKISFDYSELSREWLGSQPGMMRMLEELRDGLTLGTSSVESAKIQTADIKDCLAVIQWYQTFIHVKFMRSLMGKMSYDEDEAKDYQRDSDGSAKIAIIAIERSMQAWLRLFELLPEQEDHFLKTLGMLEKMKALALAEFPNALSFKRPGFDD